MDFVYPKVKFSFACLSEFREVEFAFAFFFKKILLRNVVINIESFLVDLLLQL